MAKVTLNADEQRIVSNSDDLIFGSTGIEGVTIAASTTGVKLDQNIESVSLHGNIGVGQIPSGFLFQQVGNNLNIYSGTNTLLTRVLVQDDADGTLLTFSNGTVHAKFDTTGATPVIKIGDVTVSTTIPAAVTVGQSTLAPTPFTPEPPTVLGNLFTLTGATTTVTHVDVANPTHGTLWWNGVPVEAKNIEDYFKEIAGTEFANLSKNLTDIAGIGDIKFNVDSSANSTTDATKGGTSTSGPTTGGATTNSATVTYNLTGGGTIDVNTTVTLDYLAFLKSMIFDSTGKSILTFVPEADKTFTHIESAAIVLTTITNNGGTFEGGLTTTGNDIIVAGRPELLHGAYIDAGGGTNNVLNVEMKGVFAQPLELLNIQTINVENAPNIYTTRNPDGSETSGWADKSTGGHYEKGSDGVVKYYPPGTAGTYPYLSDGTRLTSSTLDLTNAPNVSLLDITEAKTFGDITQRPIDLGPLTIVGIQNNATIRLEGDFTEKVTLQYGKGVGVVTTVDGQSVYTGEINVELRLGNTDHFCLDVAVNASGLHLDSQGIENFFDHLNLGGDLSTLRITGKAALVIDEALDGFRTGAANHPAIIDASANTGGVVLKVHEDYIKFTGSLASDSFSAKSAHHNDDAIVTIIADKSVAENIFNAENYHIVKISSGSGSDTITASDSDTVTIKAGDGDNTISVEKCTTVSITSGSGNDVITSHVSGRPMEGTKVTIDAGAGDNIIDASAAEITITTLGGNDTITVHGTDDDKFNGLVKISTGAGNDTVILKHLDAVNGSSITGTNVKLFVEKQSDLRYATLTGVTSVVMEEDLTLNFATLVSLGAKVFSVDPADLPKTEVHVVVTESHTLSEVLDLSTLAKNVRLTFEISSGATLTLSAEQLDKYVAIDGISVKTGDTGKVHITDAGQNFDAFDHGNYDVTGGTLDAGWKGHTDDLTVDRLDGTKGWERPAPTPSVDQLIIDSTSVTTADYHVVKLANSIYSIDTISPNLVIKGNQNVVFDAPVNLGEHDHHDARFTIDFSALTGTVKNLTVHQFDNVIKVVGNNTGTRINVELSNDLGHFSANHDGGLKSSGVAQYIVTDISDHKSISVGDIVTTSETFLKDVDFYLCDNTKDVTVIGLQSNPGHTLHFHDVPWGGVHPSILLEGDGLANWDSGPIKDQGNPDTDNIGAVVVDYFTDGAPAIVDIRNGGVALGLNSTGGHRAYNVDGITVNNAKSLTVNVFDGDAIINDLAGGSVTTVTIVSATAVTVRGEFSNLEKLQTFDVNGVTGVFTAELTGSSDLTKVELKGFDKIVFFDKEAELTLTAAQVITLGTSIFSTQDAAKTFGTLDVTQLAATQLLDLSAVQVGHIGAVTIVKPTDPLNPLVVKLDAGTNFGNAHEVDIYAGTTLEMTAAQFNTIENGKFGKWSDGQEVNTLGHGDATLVIDGLAGNAKLNLSEINVDTTILKVLGSLTATKDLEILNDHHNATKVILEIDGANSVIDLTLAKQIDKFDQIHVTANATLKLSGHQVETLGGDLYDMIKIDAGASVTLNVIGTVDAGAHDFGSHIDITGLNVVNMTIDHFEQIHEVIGTGTDTRFDVVLHGDVGKGGYKDSFTGLDVTTDGLKSTGVQTYVVDNIETTTNSAVFYLCDKTQDVQVLGLKESAGKTISFEQVPWGGVHPTFLLEGDQYANWNDGPAKALGNPDFDNIGTLKVNFFVDGAPAVVDINNGSVSLGKTSTGTDRPLLIEGIVVDNANSLVINVADGNAIIDSLTGNSINKVVMTSALNVTVKGDLAHLGDGLVGHGVLESFDASGVVGTFTADLSNTNDLSKVTIAGFDKVILEDSAVLTLNFTEFDAIGAANITHAGAAGSFGTLNLVGLDGQPFSLASLSKDIHLGTLTLADGNITLNPATDLTHIGGLVLTNGQELTLTAAQFQELDGKGSITGDGTVHITDLTQAQVTGGFDLSGVTASHTDAQGKVISSTLAMTGSIELLPTDSLGTTFHVVTMTGDGSTLTLPEVTWADGLKISGGTHTTLVFTDTSFGVFSYIDASGFGVNTLKVLNTLVFNHDIDLMFDHLPGTVVKEIYQNLKDVSPIEQVVTIDQSVSVPGFVVFNPYTNNTELTTLDIAMHGGTEIGGDLRVSTVMKVDPVTDTAKLAQHLNTINIDSTGTALNTYTGKVANIIEGDITPLGTGLHLTVNSEAYTSVNNNLLNVNISGDQAFEVKGNIVFNSVTLGENGDEGYVANDITKAHVSLNDSDSKDVTIKSIDVTDKDIDTLTVANTKGGTLTITGASPAINGGVHVDGIGIETLTLTGTDKIVIGDNDFSTAATSINAETLSHINASTLVNAPLSIGEITNIDSKSFDFISGNGVTKISLTSDTLDNKPDGNPAGTGWSFNFTDAAATSEFHLGGHAGSPLTFTKGPLDIKLGANTTLYIDESMDLTKVDLSVTGVKEIVLADGCTLTISAKNANNLHIVAGPDTEAAGITAVVNVVGLPNDTADLAPFDLSHIAANIAGTITLGAPDVTLDPLSKLGTFSVTLDSLSSGILNDLKGQTVRFTDAGQAERKIIVTHDLDGTVNNIDNSTNVVWAFNTIANTVAANKIDTSKYDDKLGRVWVNDKLLAIVPNVESLFSSPSAIKTDPTTGMINLYGSIIVHVVNTDSFTLVPLNLNVARSVEVEAFTNLAGGLTFSNPDKLVGVEKLTVELGGQVALGALNVADIVNIPISNNNTFQELVINSKLADLTTNKYLYPEIIRNAIDANKGTSTAPYTPVDASKPNKIGDITSVTGIVPNATTNSRDQLTKVTLSATGADLETGTIKLVETTSTDANPSGYTKATLAVNGTKNIKIASVTTNANIATLNIDSTGYSGTLTAPGASPAVNLNAATTRLNFANGKADTGVITLGSAANAGVAGAGLSFLDASAYFSTLNLGTIAQVNGTNVDRNKDGDTTDPGDAAFTLTAGHGLTTATLATANTLTPTLTAGSEWIFDYTNSTDKKSQLVLSSDVANATNLPANSTLNLKNVPLYIKGAADLTQLLDNSKTAVREGLIFGDGTGKDGDTSHIYIPDSQSLKLTVSQLGQADMVDNSGLGKLFVTGDATDVTLGNHIHTVNVDLSSVTIKATDANKMLDVTLGIAADDAGKDIGFNLLGSPADDNILITNNFNNTITGGVGNDIIQVVGTGSNTFNVDSGIDHIIGLASGLKADQADVLVVSSGATANADVPGTFVATAATINSGTAVLSGTGAVNHTIDVSAVTSGKGFTLIGGTSDILGHDVLIGSIFNDTIDGGNHLQTTLAAADTLTGGLGNDSFVFQISQTPPATLTVNDALVKDKGVHVIGIDQETITVSNAGTKVGDASDTVAVNWTFDSSKTSVIVQLKGVDLTDPVKVADAISTGLTAQLADTTVKSAAGVVTWTANANHQLDVTLPTDPIPNGPTLVFKGNDVGTLAGTGNHDVANDVAQISRVDITSKGHVGDTYHLKTDEFNGQSIDIGINGYYLKGNGGAGGLAVGTEVSAADIATELASVYNTKGAGAIAAAPGKAGGLDGITFTDLIADNGGFTIKDISISSGAFGGSGASIINPATLDTVDIITDFLSGSDNITFPHGQPRVGGDYFDHTSLGAFADYPAAKLAAGNAFSAAQGTLHYYYADDTADHCGLLFFSATADGSVNGVIKLIGATPHVASADIIITA